ncbi:TIGR04283 family arsenosugar biosynthesis glycosyltransferase [Flavobacteriaceae bacterium M23B6Z8]
MKISIIIPVLNEADNLSKLIPHLHENSLSKNIEEIIVSDGGSVDNSKEVIKKEQNVRFIIGPKGRALQMNKGARLAKGDILYFLHADSFPPAQFDKKILQAVSKKQEAGCFRLKFDDKHLLLRVSQWFTRWNFSICRGGDQSLFITKSLFEEMGGFNEDYTIYEDNEFTNRLYKKSSFIVLPEYVLTSARKYRNIGVFKLQYHFAVIHLKKIFGASPETLYSYYRKHIR